MVGSCGGDVLHHPTNSLPHHPTSLLLRDGRRRSIVRSCPRPCQRGDAGALGLAVDVAGAGAAEARLAADVRARQPEHVPEKMHEQDARLDVALIWDSVDSEREAAGHG